MYDPEAEDQPPENAVRLIESSYGADGMLWSSPLYQGTISGAFKNAIYRGRWMTFQARSSRAAVLTRS
jgi:NAD(P)H-dependent FMN reductase